MRVDQSEGGPANTQDKNEDNGSDFHGASLLQRNEQPRKPPSGHARSTASPDVSRFPAGKQAS